MRLFGRNCVMERLRANPKSIRKVYIQSGIGGTSYVRKRARQLGILMIVIPASRMLKIARDRNTQGVMADVEDFVYVEYADLLETALKKKRCLLFLDGVKDPQNFGAIIRSLGCLGKFSIIISSHDSVRITETVLRIACGGDNYVPIACVANLNNAIKQAKDEGICIVGAVVTGGKLLNEVDLPARLGLVMGSEQKGIRPIIHKQLDLELTIPMAIDTLSFNVAQAMTVMCYEIARQRIAHEKK